jgi:hypothetical protein
MVKSLNKNERYRGLFETEIALAKTVYRDTLPYERIFVSSYQTSTQGITLATHPSKKRANYIFLWSDVFDVDVTTEHKLSSTFIHELCHVWQSQYGKSALGYMRESAWKQFSFGVRDIFRKGVGKGFERIGEMTKKGFAREWDRHRGKAYAFKMSDIGRDFRKFNVEQQALIIETWFRKEDYRTGKTIYPAGFASENDVRFPYVRDCIWEGNPKAEYQNRKR